MYFKVFIHYHQVIYDYKAKIVHFIWFFFQLVLKWAPTLAVPSNNAS